jgi:hypothetical protein
MSSEKIFYRKDLLQHGAMRDANIRNITCLQHQKKSTATSEQGNNRTKLLQCEMQDQKKKLMQQMNIICCNIRT